MVINWKEHSNAGHIGPYLKTVHEIQTKNPQIMHTPDPCLVFIKSNKSHNFYYLNTEGEFLVKTIVSWEGVRREFGRR